MIPSCRRGTGRGDQAHYAKSSAFYSSTPDGTVSDHASPFHVPVTVPIMSRSLCRSIVVILGDPLRRMPRIRICACRSGASRSGAAHDRRIATEPALPSGPGFDLTSEVSSVFVALLCVIILLPMSWLVYYTWSTAPALHIVQLHRARSPILSFSIRWSPRSASHPHRIICCLVRRRSAGWWRAHDMPLRRTVSHAGDRRTS